MIWGWKHTLVAIITIQKLSNSSGTVLTMAAPGTDRGWTKKVVRSDNPANRWVRRAFQPEGEILL